MSLPDATSPITADHSRASYKESSSMSGSTDDTDPKSPVQPSLDTSLTMKEEDSMIGRLYASERRSSTFKMELGGDIDVLKLVPDFIIQESFPKELTDDPSLQILNEAEDLWGLLGIEAHQVAKCLLMDDIHPQWEILHNYKLFTNDTAIWLKRPVTTKVDIVENVKAPAAMAGTHYVHSIHTRKEQCIPIRFYGRPELREIEESLKKAVTNSELENILDEANIVYDAPHRLIAAATTRVWYELRPLAKFVIQKNVAADEEYLAKALFRLNQMIKLIEEYTTSTFCMEFGNACDIKNKGTALKQAKRKLQEAAKGFLGQEIAQSIDSLEDCTRILVEEVDKDITYVMEIINEVNPEETAHFVYDQCTVRPLKKPLPQRPINVVFLGKTGAGKSETVNLLVGAPVCKTSASMDSETEIVTSKEITVKTPHGDITLNIVDTPGMFDTRSLNAKARFELRDAIRQCPEGIDVVINTIKAGRYTKEEEACLKAVTETAGTEIFKHTLFIFTHAKDVLDKKSASEYLRDSASSGKKTTISTLKEVLEKEAGNRAVFIENKNVAQLGRVFQRNVILHLIYEMLNQSKCEPFSTDVVRKIQEEQEEQARKLKEIQHREIEKEKKHREQLEKDQEDLKKLKVVHEAKQNEIAEIERKRLEEQEIFRQRNEEIERENRQMEEEAEKQRERLVAAEEEARKQKEEAEKEKTRAEERHRCHKYIADIKSTILKDVRSMDQNVEEASTFVSNEVEKAASLEILSQKYTMLSEEEMTTMITEVTAELQSDIICQEKKNQEEKKCWMELKEETSIDSETLLTSLCEKYSSLQQKDIKEMMHKHAEELMMEERERKIQDENRRMTDEKQKLEEKQQEADQHECGRKIGEIITNIQETIDDEDLSQERALELIDKEMENNIMSLKQTYSKLTGTEIDTMMTERSNKLKEEIERQGKRKTQMQNCSGEIREMVHLDKEEDLLKTLREKYNMLPPDQLTRMIRRRAEELEIQSQMREDQKRMEMEKKSMAEMKRSAQKQGCWNEINQNTEIHDKEVSESSLCNRYDSLTVDEIREMINERVAKLKKDERERQIKLEEERKKKERKRKQKENCFEDIQKMEEISGQNDIWHLVDKYDMLSENEVEMMTNGRKAQLAANEAQHKMEETCRRAEEERKQFEESMRKAQEEMHRHSREQEAKVQQERERREEMEKKAEAERQRQREAEIQQAKAKREELEKMLELKRQHQRESEIQQEQQRREWAIEREKMAEKERQRQQREQEAAIQQEKEKREMQVEHDRIIKENQRLDKIKTQRSDCTHEIDMLASKVMTKVQNAYTRSGAIEIIEIARKQHLQSLKNKYSSLSPDEIQKLVDTKVDDMRKAAECFPSGAKVSTPAGEVEMSSLKHGDLVLGVGPGGEVQYSPVLLFSHACLDVTANYIKLHTENRKVLTLTPGHFLHVGELGALKAAEEVRPGDTVFTHNGEDLVPSVVVAVSEDWERGIYCPQTSSGSIIVDGVVSSCYTTFMAPRVAHALLLPALVLFRVLPLAAYNWLLPYDEASGMPGILNWSAKYVRALKVPFWGGLEK